MLSPLSDADVPAVLERFSSLSDFEGILDLSGSAITDFGIVDLVRGLSDAFSRVRSFNANSEDNIKFDIVGLKLNGCKNISYNGALEIAELIENSDSLKLFSMKNTQLKDDAVDVICDALKIQNNINELHFGGVGRDGLTHIIEVVKSVKTLKSLSFTFLDADNLFALNSRATDSYFDAITDFTNPPDPDAEDEIEEDEDDETKPKVDKVKQEADRIKKELEDDEARTVGSQNEPIPPPNHGLPSGVLSAIGVLGLKPMDMRLINGFGDGVSDMAALKTYTLLNELSIAVESPEATLTDINIFLADKVTGKTLDSPSAFGDAFPTIQRDLIKSCSERIQKLEFNEKERELRGRLTAEAYTHRILEELENPDKARALNGGRSVLPVRSFLSRSLWQLLSRALYDLQRFKAKGNKAVMTSKGEIAFLAYYLRKHRHEAAGRSSFIGE